jgi:cytochrome c-type biogenesis protein CcmH
MVLWLLLALWGAPAAAVIETYEFSDPGLEQRYQILSAELRCPKCQNQNIADSNAPIARDLRNLLHQQLEQGASDEEILRYMESRYGEFVRYRPKLSGATLWLWLAPVLLLAAGVLIVAVTLRGRKAGAGLSDSERAELDKLLRKRESEV